MAQGERMTEDKPLNYEVDLDKVHRSRRIDGEWVPCDENWNVIVSLASGALSEGANAIVIEGELIHMDVSPDGKLSLRRGVNAAN